MSHFQALPVLEVSRWPRYINPPLFLYTPYILVLLIGSAVTPAGHLLSSQANILLLLMYIFDDGNQTFFEEIMNQRTCRDSKPHCFDPTGFACTALI